MVRWRARRLSPAQERVLRAAGEGRLRREVNGTFWAGERQHQRPTVLVLASHGLVAIPPAPGPVPLTTVGRRALAETRHVSCPYACGYRGPQDDVDEHVVVLSCVQGHDVA